MLQGMPRVLVSRFGLSKHNEIEKGAAESQGDRPNCRIEEVRCRLTMHRTNSFEDQLQRGLIYR